MMLNRYFFRLFFLGVLLSCFSLLQAAEHGMTRVGAHGVDVETVIPVIDGFAYLAKEETGTIYKINSTSLELVSSLTLPSGLIRSVALDSTNGFIYAAASLGGGITRLYQIRLSDFTDQGFAIITATNPNSSAIDSQGNGYFFGFTGGLNKVRLSDLTVLVSTTNAFGGPGIALDENRGYLYLVPDGGTFVRRLRTDTLAVVDTLTISDPKFTAAGLSFVHGKYLYVANNDLASPGVSRIDLDNFSTQSYLEFVSSATAVQVYSATLDSVNGFGYFGTFPNPYNRPPVIYKVRLSDFTEIGSLTLDPADGPLYGSGYDTVTNAIFMSGDVTVRVTVFIPPGGNAAGMTQNPYPNPFRPSRGHTGITLTGFDGGQAIKIFTIGGTLVRELTANSSGSTMWDAKNMDGETVSSGIYFISTDSGVKYKVAVQK